MLPKYGLNNQEIPNTTQYLNCFLGNFSTCIDEILGR